MKNILLILAFLIAQHLVFAAPDSLVFTVQKNIPYQYLSNPTTLTTIDWDDFNAVVPLGFTFRMMHDTTSHLYFDESNGVGAELFLKPPSTQNTCNFITWIADVYDLHFDYPNLHSSVNYKTDIVSGKKITKVEWRNVGFLDLETTDSANLQAWFYEDKNIVELRFGPSSREAITGLFKDPVDGYGTKGPLFSMIQQFDVSANTFDKMYYVKTEVPAVIDSATVAQATNSLYTLGTDSFPNENTLYRWAPAVSAGNHTVLLNDNIKLYPTLVQQQLFIDQKENKQYLLTVIGIDGTVKYRELLHTAHSSINLSHLNSGQYYIVLSNQNEQISYAIMKE